MIILGRILRRLRMFASRAQGQRDLDEEIRLHIELLEQQQRDLGLSGRAAAVAARRRFGAYWLVIRPFSGLVRRRWLHAAKRRAERDPHLQSLSER